MMSPSSVAVMVPDEEIYSQNHDPFGHEMYTIELGRIDRFQFRSTSAPLTRLRLRAQLSAESVLIPEAGAEDFLIEHPCLDYLPLASLSWSKLSA